jgi:hypothetical protein
VHGFGVESRAKKGANGSEWDVHCSVCEEHFVASGHIPERVKENAEVAFNLQTSLFSVPVGNVGLCTLHGQLQQLFWSAYLVFD